MKFVAVVNEMETGPRRGWEGYDRLNEGILTAFRAQPGTENEWEVQIFGYEIKEALQVIRSRGPDSEAILVLTVKGGGPGPVRNAREIWEAHPELRVVLCWCSPGKDASVELVTFDRGNMKPHEVLRQAITG